MKFWQRAFLAILLVFLICLDVFAVLFMRQSMSLVTETAMEMAVGEQRQLEKAFVSQLSVVSAYYERFNADNLLYQAVQQAETYEEQKAYIQVYFRGTLVFSNVPVEEGDAEQFNVPYDTRKIDMASGSRYIVIVGRPLAEPLSGIKIVYVKDIESVSRFGSEMRQYFLIASIIIAVLLAVIIASLLLHMTSPLRELNNAAKEIAAGDLGKRVTVASHDEIGEFAGTFNQMADSIERHIDTQKALAEERQRFIDNLAHELRTPITAIMGYGEYLKFAKGNDQDTLRAKDYIIDQSKRIRNLSEKMMNLSRLTGGQITLSPIAMKAPVESALYTMAGQMRARGVQLESKLHDAHIEGDSDMVETLALNLIENAVRASGPNQKVTVTIQALGFAQRLIVQDEGIGIPKEEQARILEPFYRVDPSRSRANGGVGLGLSLVRQICMLHKASLTIQSEPGKGTAMIVDFPPPLK